MKEEVYQKSYSEKNQPKWLEFFMSLSNKEQVFGDMLEQLKYAKRQNAEVVGKLWYEFSCFMPFFLTRAASMLNTNEQRAYIIQVAYEELGYGDPDKMHYLDFKNALESIGVRVDRYDEIYCSDLLQELSDILKHKTDDAGILGMCLGLEIIANENIEVLFESLAYCETARQSLEKSVFFKIHRVNEDDHIALNVSNFIRFCDTEEKKKQFIFGFKDSVKFWQNFWQRSASWSREL